MSRADSVAGRRILVLPGRLADQIAAGEVVERPASVAKELIENALDAGAARVEVEVERGGARLVRVRDDGCGIHREDLRVALERHATSKIASLEDLQNATSLGFRGEALPSIASVSRLELSSRRTGEEHAFAVSSEAGDARAEPRPVALAVGTTVSVHDLFYNTPARRKFLRTERTEFGHLEDVVKRLALARMDVGFVVRHNAREIFSVRPARREIEQARRLARLCGAAFAEQALAVELEATGLRLTGWLSAPEASRSQADRQYFFVNGRAVSDKLVRHAIRQAYHELIPGGRHPAYVLYLALPPSEVDVNVHPTKHEVRFRDGRSVHDFLVHRLRDALTSPAALGLDGDEDGAARAGPTVGAPAAPHSGRVRDELAAYARLHGATEASPEPATHPDAVRDSAAGAFGEAIGQVGRRYIVCGKPDALVLVDALAARRRVVLERLRRALRGAGIRRRPLLVPVRVVVGARQADALEGAVEVLEHAGFDIRRVGPDTLSCRQVPATLAEVEPQALTRSLVAALGPAAGDDGGADGAERLLGRLVDDCDLLAGCAWEVPGMNALLRELEALETHGSGGDLSGLARELSKADLEAMLGTREAS